MANGTLHLGTIRGTNIELDFSFVVFIAFIVMQQWDAGPAEALLWVPVALISVLVHELAHATAIGAFGYGASEIHLRGLGGVTMNARRARPWHDMIISLAGPLSSFAIAGVLLFLTRLFPIIARDPMLRAFVPLMVFANIWWGILNLLPISPLDGGHVLRNLVHMVTNARRAFLVDVWVSMIAGGAIGLFEISRREIFLAALMAYFIWLNFQRWSDYKAARRMDDL